MRGIIIGLARRDKGSFNDPSFAFKVSVIATLLFLTSGGVVSETGTVRKVGELNLEASEHLATNQEEIFSTPRTATLDEPSDLIIAQGNTLYASSPLFVPETQILGALSLSDTGKREIVLHSVQSGETLDGIASRFGISQNTIIWANELKNSTIRPGQDLVILPVTGVFHIAASGDTVGAIASKYRADVADVVEFNRLDGKSDINGDILIIPGGEIRMPSVATTPSAPLASSSWLISPASGQISQGLHWYNAVDIATNCGAPVYAAADGTIQTTGHHPVAGSFVRITHPNGVVTFYGHLSRIGVTAGQFVSQGFHIGDIGNTGHTIGPTGCHVHFEVRGAANPFLNYPRGHRF